MRSFRAKELLWHTADERYVQPGEVVDLSHLSLDALESLLNAGAIEPVEDSGPELAGRIDLRDGISQKEASEAGRALTIRKRGVKDATGDQRDLVQELQG